MTQKLIYIADDEKNIRHLISTFLQKDGYQVESFDTGDKLYEAFLKTPCDLAILDIMMPGSSGLIICTKLRDISPVPIIMLTARDTEEDYISGISLGSDDYFTKPFSPVKLTMRVKAMLRRVEMDKQTPTALPTLSLGNTTIHPDNLTVTVNHQPLPLTGTEFNLLAYLVENNTRAISREELLSKIWGYERMVESRATDDTVKRLRRKLQQADSSINIETVWGFGFRIHANTEANPEEA